MNRPRIRVSIPVFRECDPSIIYGVFDTLWAAGRQWEHVPGGSADGLFEPRLLAVDTQPLQLITGVHIVPQDTIAGTPSTDIVFVPNVIIGAGQSPRDLDRDLIDWIRRMNQGGAQIYAACGGAIVLAEAALLDGHEATTHFTYAPIFDQYYPKVRLRIERILVQTGPDQSLYCAGGASSWQDLALLLIAKHGGTQEAIRMSKLFLYQWHRDGQLPFVSMIQNVRHGDAVILECQNWIARNYERQSIIAELVQRSGLPKRSFDRRFRAATGYSPLAYVQTLRIEEAKQILETSDATASDIAHQVGYEDEASFRRLFRRMTGMTPSTYRRTLRPPKALLAPFTSPL
ncbi:helix-turn-helix domain-containing protein [Xanthobacter autotrophicus]|uniref:GlxA family transcriptional regulator n=1 Tax=Xanthobacter TaxID=279 RepID=UPI0024AA71EA|nr:helix-turn-helix domain-containing protein [Xanthobacter autotrophicus]MDI4664738.1 helix-turn-helix domain-containing protein [Xanthobacter autotrophicus]